MPQDSAPRILVVDDELNICQTCTRILTKTGYSVDYALNGHDALAKMNRNPYDILVTDLKMSRLGGLEVLRQVTETYPETPVIVMTGYATVSSAVEVMKMGAVDYLPKPFTPDELRGIVEQAVAEREIRLQNRILQQQLPGRKPVSHQLIGDSPKIKQVVSMIQKVAPTDSTVLIYGESGTGKELVARAVHANSRRGSGVFFAVDCGTLSSNLLESELFGHVKGAFTGADRDKVGIFQSADRGTVFLDEISNISLEAQGKLLRFLETREFMPLGGTTSMSVDIRLILATNKNLEELVACGAFREDFYYRIYVYPILLPPLRDRKIDLLPIAYHFLGQFNRRLGKKISGIDSGAATRMLEYDWPGNVRQLRNVIERAAILCEKGVLSLKDLPLSDGAGEAAPAETPIPATNEELKRVKKEVRREAVRDIEKKFVLKALAENDWNVTRAARAVKLQRSNFHYLMRKYGIDLRKGNKPK